MNSNLVLFAMRNVKIFFRDRTAVIFSMFAALIVIALYFLFIGESLTSEYSYLPNARTIIDSWAMGGLMGVVPVTTTLAALGIMIQDRITGAVRDFTVSPMKRYEIVGGYVLSTFIISTTLSLLSLGLAEAYIVSGGGPLLTGIQFASIIGVLLLSVLSASAVMLVVALFLHSNNAYSAVSTVVGTLIGFIVGAFIPLGFLPSAVASFTKIIPATHSASLFRQIFMEKPMESMAGMPPEEILDFEFKMGIKLGFGGEPISPEISIMILAGVCVLFYFIAIVIMSKKQR